jgi:hypothetical protein
MTVVYRVSYLDAGKGPQAEVEAARRETWFVYIVHCGDGTLYTGITKDVSRRCQQHNAHPSSEG